MISRVSSVAFDGIWAKEVDVQVAIAKGLPNFTIVGLADKSVSESKERLRSAFYNLGFSLPAERITVNLSPSDLSKEGNHFDLPIALALLGSMNIIDKEQLLNTIAIGEITLDGEIKPSNGVLAACMFALEHNKNIIIPKAQEAEAHIVHDKINVIPASNILDIVKHFKGHLNLNYNPNNVSPNINTAEQQFTDLASIKGHTTAKHALVVAAAGGHNMLMIAPPGSGKSMLANAMGGILPPLTSKEMLETSLIYSVIGELKNKAFVTTRPYRAPHHSASLPSLVGGGSKAKPGEITLAHNGILFLDEFAEFNANMIDALRQPIENGEILISRVNSHVTYPARFQLITAMNPCRCGYFGDKERQCTKAPKCTETYQSKISGPILDRIDIIIEVAPVSIKEINTHTPQQTSAQVQQQVIQARQLQKQRYSGYGIETNAQASSEIIEQTAELTNDARELLNLSAEKFKFSTRGYFRIIKTARTIADLENSNKIGASHVSQAIGYRKINYYQQSLQKSYIK